jgi:hypothetical protein
MTKNVPCLLAACLLTTAVVVELGTAYPSAASAGNCFIDEVDYYDGPDCTNMVGSVAQICSPQDVWSWGEQTSYWIQVIDGGDPYCGCGGAEYHTYNPGTCPPWAPAAQ